MSQHAIVPEDSDIAVIFTAEFLKTPSAPVWARLRIGGVPVSESEVLLANKETSAGVHSYIFDAKHVAAEGVALFAPMTIEWKGEGVENGDPEESKPSIAARSMAIYIRDHIAPDLAEAPRRRLSVDGLNGIPGISCVMPRGAFCVLPNVSSFGRSSAEIATHLLYDAGVCTLAGTAFGRHGEGHLRMSYANSRENLEAAIERMGSSLASLERSGELVTAVTVPVLDGWQGYAKVGVRNAMVIAIASVCLAVDRPTRTVRVALGAVAPTAIRAPDAEAWVAGEIDWGGPPVSDAVAADFGRRVAAAARPIDDHRSTAAYRRHAIAVLATRLIRRAFP